MEIVLDDRDLEIAIASERIVETIWPDRQRDDFGEPFTTAIATAPFDPWTSLLAFSLPKRTGTVLYGLVLKRWFDITFAAVATILLLPLFFLIVLMIRLDSPGPAIFRQTRVGRGGRSFVVFKFRTMRVADAEIRFFEGPDGQLRHKIRRDPRVTRLGRLLRRTSLDELPQLFNVLRGDMSLIGPRPELPGIVEHYQSWQHRRHLVRPGLTGWWQVQGRSDRPMHEHTELDLYYVENLSPGLDLQIVRRTIRVVLSGFGAF